MIPTGESEPLPTIFARISMKEAGAFNVTLPVDDWTVRDKSIAAIQNGTVTGIADGDTTLTGTAALLDAAKNLNVKICVTSNNLKAAKVETGDTDNLVFTGHELEPGIEKVVFGKKTLSEGSDYTVTYEDNIYPGNGARIIVTGVGFYEGSSLEVPFSIKGMPFSQLSSDSRFSMGLAEGESQYRYYDGTAQEPAFEVSFDGCPLREGIDYELSYSGDNRNAGSNSDLVYIWVYGKNSFAGGGRTNTVFLIQKAPLNNSRVCQVKISACTYTGEAQEPAVSVEVNGSPLPSEDYTVEYANNVAAGQATATISAKGDNTSGKRTVKFEIAPVDIESSDAVVIDDIGDQTFTGAEIEPVPALSFNGKPLVAGSDYTVSNENNTDAGTATATIKGKGNFAGTVELTFEILPAPIEDALIDLPDCGYTGIEQEPEAVIVVDGNTLVKDSDYTIAFTDNRDAGTGKATITGTRNYTGATSKTFTIAPANLDDATVEVGDATYDGTELEPPVTVRLGDIEIPASDYLVEYRDNIDAGTAMVAVSPKTGNVTGAKERAFTIAQASIAQAVVAAAVSETPYTGSAQEPEATVELGSTLLAAGHDYEIAYTDNTDAGTATITATGTGNYTGTASTTFDITPIPVGSLAINVPETITYTGEAFEPVEVLLDGAPLPAGDYRIDYEANKLPGDATFTFTPTSGNIVGDYSGSFHIKGLPITEDDISLAQGPYIYCAAAIEPAVSVTIDGTQLERGTDFTVAYDNHTDAGEATVIVTGAGVYEPDSFTLPFTILPRDIADAQVTLTPDTFLADGSAHQPAISVAVRGIGSLNGDDFEAAFGDAASAAVGAYQVLITGKGNFTGEAAASYEIAETKTITDAASVSFTYKLESGKATVVRVDANGATEIVVPETLEGNPDGKSQALPVGCVTKEALAGNGQVTSLTVKSADTELEEGALEGISPNASVSAPAGSPAAEAAAKHDGEVAEAAADTIAGMLPAKVASDADAEAVKAAREAYDALSEAQKAKVDPAIVEQLEAAEGAAKEYAAAKEEAAKPEKPLAKGAVKVAGSGASKAKYQVTATATAKAPGQVAYAQAQTGKAKAASIPATVKIGSYTYKVTSVAANAFKGNASITSIAIGANVAKIGANAFAGCKNLAKVTGGAGVTSIGNGAFKGLTKLSSVPKFAKLVTLGANAFNGCKALKTFAFGAKVTKIGKQAFLNCKKLSSVTFKTTKLKSVGAKAFKGTAAKITVKAPKAKKAAYKKLLKKAGVSKKAKYK